MCWPISKVSLTARKTKPCQSGPGSRALVPEGALVLPNPHGTAARAGHRSPAKSNSRGASPSWLIMLPGPPRELRPMFTDAVVAVCCGDAGPSENSFICRTFADDRQLANQWSRKKIRSPLEALVAAGLDLGYCGAAPVRWMFVWPRARSRGRKGGGSRPERVVREQLRGYIYGLDDEELESVLVRNAYGTKGNAGAGRVMHRRRPIANRLTNVPGASAVFLAGPRDVQQCRQGKVPGGYGRGRWRSMARVSGPVSPRNGRGAQGGRPGRITRCPLLELPAQAAARPPSQWGHGFS